MSADIVLLARAADYAARQHIAQRRKGERAEPYVNHLIEVAALLAEATGGDDATLLAGGKRLQIDKTPSKSRRAKLLKIADKTSNLRSMVNSPPKGWSPERLRDYVVWAEQVVRSCRGLNAALDAAFDAAHADAKRHLG